MKKVRFAIIFVIFLTAFSNTVIYADVAKEDVDILGKTNDTTTSTQINNYAIRTDELLTIATADKYIDITLSVDISLANITTTESTATNIANTGDSSPIVALLSAFIISVLGLILLRIKKIKKSVAIVLAVILLSGVMINPAYAMDLSNSRVNVTFSDEVLELFTFGQVLSASDGTVDTIYHNDRVVGFQWNLGNKNGKFELLYRLYLNEIIPDESLNKIISIADSIFSFENSKNKIIFPQVAIQLQEDTLPNEVVYTAYSEIKKVNIPNLVTGMKEIKFDEAGLPIDITTDDRGNASWYDYQDQGTFLSDGKGSKWANAMTNDGSMWVWIPRYAYRITYYTDDTYAVTSSSKTKFGKIEVVFLKDKSDIYVIDEVTYTAKRAGDVTITMGDYVVHPAFTDERSTSFANGGWDSELTGLWVAKFEAGFAPLNDPNLADTSLTFTAAAAAGNYYGAIIPDSTYLKYPVFKPNAYSYNFINIGDSYALSKALNSNDNPYGLSSATADTHLMKNSEWGVVIYLAHSQYGRNGNQITINNSNAGDTVNKIYGITGIGGNTINAGQVISINPSADNQYNGMYGKLASTTGNVYGIYDMSGGLYERTASYLNNNNAVLSSNGIQIVDDGGNINTKYKTLYEVGSTDVNTNNYDAGVHRIGEAIWETSVSVGNNGSWFDDYSAYLRTNATFLHRGGYYSLAAASGGFAFSMGSGDANSINGFRPAICPVE